MLRPRDDERCRVCKPVTNYIRNIYLIFGEQKVENLK